MRQKDKTVFSMAAAAKGAWILVRRTNPASLRYVCETGYFPKPIECKAKTADLDSSGKQLAGLVIDPTVHPRAFNGAKVTEAKNAWKSFVNGKGNLPTGYSVDENRNSKHYGCVRYGDNYLHGDYDLYDIIWVKHPRGNIALIETLRGVLHRRGPGFLAIQKFINDRIGSPVVQHGGEMQYADHSEQSIDAFGPLGEQTTLLNEYTIRKWYQSRFDGRVPIPV